MDRQKKETMCIQNLGASVNNGNPIPKGIPYRVIHAALNNNPNATALSDEEIEELSKHNEGAVVPGTTELEGYYRIEFVGDFSFDNICYAIIRPCRCVKSHNDKDIVLKTAKFSSMNSITRLFKRLEENEIKQVTVFRVDENNNEDKIGIFNSTREIIEFIQDDKKKLHRCTETKSIVQIKEFEERKMNNDIINRQLGEIEELKKRINSLESEYVKIKKEKDELMSIITQCRNLLSIDK